MRFVLRALCLAVTVVALLVSSTPAHACACDPFRRWTVPLATRFAEHIVVGEVIGRDSSNATVRVEQVLSGPLAEGDTLTIDNHYLYGVCCGVRSDFEVGTTLRQHRFEAGDRVLLYVGSDGRQPVTMEASKLGEGFYRIEGHRLYRAGCYAGTLGRHLRGIERALGSSEWPKTRKSAWEGGPPKRRCGRERRPAQDGSSA